VNLLESLTGGGRLRIVAVVLIGILTAMAGGAIATARPIYAESATVIFALPRQYSPASSYTWQAQSLIATGSAISQVLMGPQVASRIRAAGGTASYDLALVNLYNQDYPDYEYPEAQLTVSSLSAINTHHTFLIAKRVLTEVLAQWQGRAGAPAADRIVADVTDESGPEAEIGSRKRSLAGLVLLALVCGGTAWSILGRRKRVVSRARHRALAVGHERGRDPLTSAAIPQGRPAWRRRRGQR
jgi:hypothetical protein